MEMLFTGAPISAHDALLHGLVSKVVPEERLEEETLTIARRVCQASRPVVALGKATFHRYLRTFQTFQRVSHERFTVYVFHKSLCGYPERLHSV